MLLLSKLKAKSWLIRALVKYYSRRANQIKARQGKSLSLNFSPSNSWTCQIFREATSRLKLGWWKFENPSQHQNVQSETSSTDISESEKWNSRHCSEIFPQEVFIPCIYIALIIDQEYVPCIYIDQSIEYLLPLSIQWNFQHKTFTIYQCRGKFESRIFILW